MKISVKEFAEWIANNRVLQSAKVNNDLETIVNEARKELKDESIKVDDVRAAANYRAAQRDKVAAGAGTAEGKAK